MIELTTPIRENCIRKLKIRDIVTITGTVYTGRDAALPKVVRLIQEDSLKDTGIDLTGGVIFHTAVSFAGVGPTSSNKVGIESSMEILSKAGVKLHLGKGALKKETAEVLKKYRSVYAVIPPVTALLNKKIINQQIVAFPEEGMEAMYRLSVIEFPAIIAIAQGESIYER